MRIAEFLLAHIAVSGREVTPLEAVALGVLVTAVVVLHGLVVWAAIQSESAWGRYNEQWRLLHVYRPGWKP